MTEYIQKLISEGVNILNPESIHIRGTLSCGENVIIDNNVIFEGKVLLENNVSIGANSILKDCTVKKNSYIKPFSIIESSIIGENSFVGPFSRIRSKSKIDKNVQIGNFVYIKNSEIASNGRINHLSYIADSTLDNGVTIGAGTISNRESGKNAIGNKIGKNASVGSSSTLIANINIGKNATIGAGSVVYKDVIENKLSISRPRQNTIKKWIKNKKNN